MTDRIARVHALPSPWDTFLTKVDAQLSAPVEIHCLGGFVLHVMYDLPRPTADIDFIAAVPNEAANELMKIAGRGTALAKKHKLYVQLVTVSDFPDDYETRLVNLAPGALSKLRLRALAPEDLVLAKLTRNSPKDIHDVRFLAQAGVLDPALLRARYRDTLRPYLVNTERHDLTLDLWIEEIESAAGATSPNQHR